jgi:preprotein translocase subunit SecG
MSVLTVLFVLAHAAVSMVLILVVLLQTGKRADLAGAFGGGGSQTAFGARGAATLLSKATTVCAVIFMITSLALSILTSRSASQSGSVLDEVPLPPASSAPAPPPSQEGQAPPVGSPAPSSEPAPTPAPSPQD